MADRYFYKTQALQREVKMIFMEVAIGATGAPTISATDSKGVTSITRAAQGNYDIVLDDPYNEVVNIHATLLEPTAEDITFQMEQRSGTAGTFSIFTNAAATATDPSDGSTILMTIFVRNVPA